MYLRGRLTFDLSGTLIDLKPPSHFFAGVANMLTKGSWDTKEELETYKLMAFAQSANRALTQLGVDDVIRVSVANEVIYEDLNEQPNDFGLAMQALQQKLAQGYEPDPHSEFDLVLKHDDGVLSYVIDLDFVREHKVGAHPVSIQVTAIPTVLRRNPGEDETAFRNRIGSVFADQYEFDRMQGQWDAQLEGFLNLIADHFRTAILVENVQVETRRFLPRQRDPMVIERYSGWGYPLYGYDPMYDLAYLMMWDSLWADYHFRVHNLYYGDPGWSYAYVGDGGMGYTDYSTWDNNFGGGAAPTGDWASPSSDSGGGGWLSNVGDFSSSSSGDSGGFSWGSDSGGGGDVSSGSSCGGSSSSCSSASSCGGGGSSCGGCGGGSCSS